MSFSRSAASWAGADITTTPTSRTWYASKERGNPFRCSGSNTSGLAWLKPVSA
jgi:hypothetical protein